MKTAVIVCIVFAIFCVAFATEKKCHVESPSAPCAKKQPWTLDRNSLTRYCCAVGEKISAQGGIKDNQTWFTCICLPGEHKGKADKTAKVIQTRGSNTDQPVATE
ncbi:hypothetical protein RRG08_056583 [Elysia crispata]|uniref:Uncharacterized protein n=1 Tax=Elysia crispata TaxID=231223 RepID=A0AAE0Z7D2_9GAST|nr:hypothetical protein RRG08_056583 [Elysia crispata]